MERPHVTAASPGIARASAAVATMRRRHLRHVRHQRGIEGRERRAVHADVVIEARAVMPAHLQRAPAATGGELHDHVRAMPADTILEGGELRGVAARRFVVVPDMHMHQRGAGLVRRMGAFDLLGNGDRQGRVVLTCAGRSL
jgi:hypothetical protein